MKKVNAPIIVGHNKDGIFIKLPETPRPQTAIIDVRDDGTKMTNPAPFQIPSGNPGEEKLIPWKSIGEVINKSVGLKINTAYDFTVVGHAPNMEHSDPLTEARFLDDAVELATINAALGVTQVAPEPKPTHQKPKSVRPAKPIPAPTPNVPPAPTALPASTTPPAPPGHTGPVTRTERGGSGIIMKVVVAVLIAICLVLGCLLGYHSWSSKKRAAAESIAAQGNTNSVQGVSGLNQQTTLETNNTLLAEKKDLHDQFDALAAKMVETISTKMAALDQVAALTAKTDEMARVAAEAKAAALTLKTNMPPRVESVGVPLISASATTNGVVTIVYDNKAPVNINVNQTKTVNLNTPAVASFLLGGVDFSSWPEEWRPKRAIVIGANTPLDTVLGASVPPGEPIALVFSWPYWPWFDTNTFVGTAMLGNSSAYKEYRLNAPVPKIPGDGGPSVMVFKKEISVLGGFFRYKVYRQDNNDAR